MVRSLAATQYTGVRIPLRAPIYKGVAQLVEPRSPKPKVGGSSPSTLANFMQQDVEE